jgi:hypothetical protein
MPTPSDCNASAVPSHPARTMRDLVTDAATCVMPGDIADGWGTPSEDLAPDIKEIRAGVEDLTSGLLFRDLRSALSNLVNSSGLRDFPVHRWYYYKEGFSPLLPPLVLEAIGGSTSQTIVDTFAGVATTALSLRSHAQVSRVIGIEYSPFVHFVGQTKLASLNLDVTRLTAAVDNLSKFRTSRRKQVVPQLSAFHNPDIFEPKVLRELIAFRDAVRGDESLSDTERAFFMLGIAAITEDLSGAMKDGRALRILHDRQRRRQGLRPNLEPTNGAGVRSVITNQWRAMIEDLAALQPTCSDQDAVHIRGDARELSHLGADIGQRLIPDSSVSLHLYSPPYLNCIDYTEVYKLELWLLEFVSDQTEFRRLREGTLRSHPSIEFSYRPPRHSRNGLVYDVIDATTSFLVDHLSRAPLGRVHGHYFSDMDEVLHEQYQTLEPGGAIACIVANSTFARRVKSSSGTSELWRVPILTDVLIARLAEAVGFVNIEIWIARRLQAKNVSDGFARESIVVARKPS